MAFVSYPNKIKSFFSLIRLNKPIGFLLLMWPSWFALADTKTLDNNLLKWYIIFFIGAFLMRSAGCIINDIIDINLDRNIIRTLNRPLVTKEISLLEGYIFLALLLVLSFYILIQFKITTIFIGLCSIPLIIIYPYMKRITYWPQLFLGISFSWGIIMVSFEFLEYLSLNNFILFIACIFWTLAYDTVYAYQDINDDIKNKIFSTAVLFRESGKKYVFTFYSIFLLLLSFISFRNNGSFISFLVIIMILFTILVFLNKWEINSTTSSNKFFKENNIFGLICFLYLLVF